MELTSRGEVDRTCIDLGRGLGLRWPGTISPFAAGTIGPGQADRRDRESRQKQRRESKKRGHSIPPMVLPRGLFQPETVVCSSHRNGKDDG